MEGEKDTITLNVENRVESANGEIDSEDNIGRLKREIEMLRSENMLLVRQLERVQENSEQGSDLVPNGSEERSFAQYKFSASDIKEMIEPFDPSISTCMTTSEWLSNIETLREIYLWDEKMTLFYAVLRLQGAAKFWFQSKQSDIKNWKQFKIELKESFPCERDDSEILLKIMSRKRKREECVENYFYSIAALAKRIKLTEYSTINYIISGLGDKNLINVLTAANCTSLPQLLTQIKRYEDIQGQELRREAIFRGASTSSSSLKFYPNDSMQTPLRMRQEYRVKERNPRKIQQQVASTTLRDANAENKVKGRKNIRCYRCDATGHYAKECNAVEKKRHCYICKQSGHYAKDCENIRSFNKNIGKIENVTNSTGTEYYPTIEIGGIKVRAFLDLGSDVTTITSNEVTNNSWKMDKCNTILHGFGGSKCRVLGKINKTVKIGNVEENIEILVVSDDAQSTPVIIGKNFLDRPGIRITKRPGQFEIVREIDNYVGDIPVISNNNDEPVQVRKITVDELNTPSETSESDKEQLINLLNNFSDCFSYGIKDIGKTDLVSMKIQLKEHKVVQYKPYKVPYGLKSKLREKTDELLASGIIRHSTSEYASPTIMIPKKNGEYRMCIDYRKLNSLTKREQFPVPNIEETLNTLVNKKIFTSLDFQSGYYQIPIEESSRQYTAFVTPEGHYEFNCVPFGLTNSPAVFLRLMSKLVEPIKSEGIIVYMDDILIPTETISENLRVLNLVLLEIRKAGLTLNVKKCEFLQHKLEFLGHEITGEGIKPGTKKTGAVANFQRPTNIREVRQFLGLTGYFRRFVNGYAQLAAPLNQLLRKDAKFTWSQEEEQAFQQLKAVLTKRPILALYDPQAQHEVHTDASSHGLAGILMQISPKDEKPRVISCFSRATTTTESKYHSYELKALAVVESLERLKHYSLMKKFRIITDCNSLRMTQEKRNLVPRIARWWLKIQEYDFELEFRSGKQLSHVDALSRIPWEKSNENETVADNVLIIGIPQEDWVASLQRQDPRLDEIRKVLDGEITNHENKDGIKGNYVMQDGRLFKKTDTGYKFVVPNGIRWRILRSMHDDRGHCGVSRTLENIRKHFWFSNMKPVVTKYVNNCIDCLYNQRSVDERRYTLHPQEVLPIPFHTIHMDHLGPFPKSKSGNQYVIGLVDTFTKLVVFKPTSTTASRSVVKMLDEICQYFGLPTRIITDRGSSFTSKEFERYCSENVIKHIKTAVKTPRANGQIERYFRTLKAAISTMTQDVGGRDWDKNVNKIQIALNSTRHTITKRTPQEILMGYTPRNIIDNKITLLINTTTENDPEASLNIDFNTLREEVKQRIDENRFKQATKHNSTAVTPRRYEKGDLVLAKQELAACGQPRKIHPRFRGPYEIKSVIGNDRYVVGDMESLQISQKPYEAIQSAENLKPWCTLMDISFDNTDDDESNEEDEGSQE